MKNITVSLKILTNNHLVFFPTYFRLVIGFDALVHHQSL